LIVHNWGVWILLALTVYATLTVIGELKLLNQLIELGKMTEFTAWMIYYSVYVASCVLSCIAFITTFRKHVQSRIAWWSSLSENAYLIYLVHFIFVTWIQFSLLSINLPAFFKFLITFILSLSLSWATSIFLRKIKIIKKYV
jgi:glucans biosynthesis protein C